MANCQHHILRIKKSCRETWFFTNLLPCKTIFFSQSSLQKPTQLPGCRGKLKYGIRSIKKNELYNQTEFRKASLFLNQAVAQLVPHWRERHPLSARERGLGPACRNASTGRGEALLTRNFYIINLKRSGFAGVAALVYKRNINFTGVGTQVNSSRGNKVFAIPSSVAT